MAFDPYIVLASLIGLGTASAFVAVGRTEPAHASTLPRPPIVAASSSSNEGLGPRPSDATHAPIVYSNPARALSPQAQRLITARAREEVEHGVKYDASYYPLLNYPGGDVPADRGACTDMVIRAFRAANIDFQVLIHEDMKENLDLYAAVGVEEPNRHVDHRRTGPLFLYFQRNTTTLPNIKHDATKTASSTRAARDAFRAGDIVFFNYKTKCHLSSKYQCIPDHVALVSDRIGPRGLPLVLQNGGPAAIESDSLDGGTMVGHFRLHD